MILTDTHTHLYAQEFNEDRTAVIQECIVNEITRFFLPNIDKSSVSGMLALTNEFPENCFPMIGIHPCSVNENWQQELEEYKELLSTHKMYAIGEIGIDLYWDKSTSDIQKQAFEAQILLAKKEKLPIVIHAREAFDEIFEILDKHNDDQLRGIFHCFTGNTSQAKKILNYGGFKIGIGGVVTFKNSGLDKVVKNLSLNDLVLETDSPYLAPHPHRGKRNNSTYLTLIAKKVADIFEVKIEKVAEITTKNSKTVFGI